MSQPIQVPTVGTLLTEFFRLVGSVRPELEEVVIPTVLVGDLSGSAPPTRRRHASCVGGIAAAAAENAWFELSNSDPNTLAVITDVFAFATAADFLKVAFPTATLLAGGSTVVATSFTDSRVLPGGPGFVLRQISQGGGSIGNEERGRWIVPVAANGLNLHLRPKGWVIRTPTRLTFSNVTAAGTMFLGLEWDEYQLP